MVIRLLRLIFLLLGCGLVTDLSAKPAVARIRVAAPIVTYRTFPEGHPPIPTPTVGGIEGGTCHTTIGCQAQVVAEAPNTRLAGKNATVKFVELSVSATILVCCKEGYAPDIMEHEETHRAISEHFYAMANAVAQRLADAALGRKFPFAGKDKKRLLDDALEKLETQLVDDFTREIYGRTEFAQDRFDTITNHGNEPITNADAMARALRDEAEHWRTQAAGPAK